MPSVNHLRVLLPAIAVLFVAGCASTEPTVEADEPVPAPLPPVSTPIPETPTAPPVLPPLEVAAVGDMMLGTDYPENILPDDDGIGFLREVTPVLANADVAFGNLEGVLIDGGEPFKKCKNPKACYLFRSPTRYAIHLQMAGFDVMSLANNHARDFGEEGRTATMTALAQVGIQHSGREGDVASWRVDGHEVALIAFAPNVDSYLSLDLDAAANEVAKLADTHAVVVVSFHGGAEGADVARLPFGEEFYYGEPRGNVVDFAHTVIDAGADLVIGHGPHVPRALQLYRGRLIAYSLGNFATYYGISVEGQKGLAPILLATLDPTGRLIEGQIVSAIQIRPGGPRIDPQQRAYDMMRELTELDFGAASGLRFEDDGRFFPGD